MAPPITYIFWCLAAGGTTPEAPFRGTRIARTKKTRAATPQINSKPSAGIVEPDEPPASCCMNPPPSRPTTTQAVPSVANSLWRLTLVPQVRGRGRSPSGPPLLRFRRMPRLNLAAYQASGVNRPRSDSASTLPSGAASTFRPRRPLQYVQNDHLAPSATPWSRPWPIKSRPSLKRAPLTCSFSC